MRKFYDEPPDGTMKEVTPSERVTTIRRLVEEARLGTRPSISYVKELLDILDINRDITEALTHQHDAALWKIKRLTKEQDILDRALKLACDRWEFRQDPKIWKEKAAEELAQEQFNKETQQDMVDAWAFSLKVNPPA
jgi:hypothetical protein